ncbi:xin actin-binding repeat-containing protein 1 isoform X1 [Mus musculus]|uniref:Xin actin-binding repeat-containing protein 1 n=2 Tax=Mus musculus TaxID=10090 RepID=XIRP1_MOUSE|nr:xin actin-binding repeat-containing protein 1 isoform X1 [Mus musculus]XP_030100109.2 xin actin-binding repeat-containing protein 1 isoform X1 [Mus musculus]
MADAQMQVAPTPTIQMRTEEDLSLPHPSAPEGLPPPPPKETFSKFQQQRQASELRRLYKHIHPELRKNLEEAVAEDLAEVLGSEEPTEGDVQCMRWIFENWRLDAIGDHERPAAREPVSGGNVQATSRKFEEGSFTNSSDQEPEGLRPSGGDVQAARQMFETKPLDALRGQEEATQTTMREPAATGDVQGTRKLFETRPLDRLGSRPSIQEQSPLELRSEIQELKGDVKKTVKLFQTEPLCAIQDAEGTIHEVKAACREEIQSNAVRSARWLFETRPLDAFNQDPSQVRVIRGISLEEGALPDVSATRWIFETQPLDAIREIEVDEKDFQPSPDLIPPGPDVQHQRHLFETCSLDTLKGERETEAEVPPKEEVIPGDVRSTLWLFETKPLDAFRDQVQVGHLQRVGHQEGEGLVTECLPSNGTSVLPLSQGVPQNDGLKGDVKTFKNLFETLPLDSIGQGEPSAYGNINRGQNTDSAEQSQGSDAPVYAMQDSRGQLHALTSVSREQVVGGDVQGYKWMFETQPLDTLGRSPSTIDVVRGITRQEVVAGDVGTTRWLFETQPLEMIHQQEQQKPEEEEGKGPGGPPPELPKKGDVQTIRWLFETYPMSELAEKRESEVTDPVSKAETQSCTWMFGPQSLNPAEGSGEQHLQTSQVPAGDRQTDRHVFETESLPASNQSSGRKPVRYCSRVEIPSGQVSRQKEVFQALEAGKKEVPETTINLGSIPTGSVHKFTWLFENCPMGSLAAESIRGDNLQEEQPKGSAGHGTPERQETAAERTLRTLHATPGILHHGGILMEARGPGELCLAKYVLPSPGQGRPYIRKEELVCGELPRIVRQVLRRTDVDQQGLLVQEDTAGQLQLHPLTLPGPGDPGNIEDMDPELQQLLACGLGVSVSKTGLVMQETGQGLVALTAYSLQPQLTSRAPERSSVQLLASCIDKGDLHSLHSLRWEPPTDPSSGPATEESQRVPPTESIIHVTPLDSTMEMGQLRISGSTPCPPPSRAAGKVVLPNGKPVAQAPLQEARKKTDISHAGQKGKAASGRPEGTIASPLGSGAPDLQEAMQNLRLATAEAQSLHQQVLSRHPQGSDPVATSMPVQDVLQASTPATGVTQGSIRPVAGSEARIPAFPRKVSGDNKAVPRGLPRGWVTIQDGIYAAHPVRTSDPHGAIQPSEKEPHLRHSPPQADQGQSPRPGYREPGGHTQRAWEPLGKVMPQISLECLRAADTSLKTAPLTHHTLTSKPAGASLHSHNASVPPPPTLPAAVTEDPDHPTQGHHQEDSIQQAPEPLQEPLLHIHNRPSGQKTPEGSETKPSKAESTMLPRKKPPVPPKPAHLSQIHPPQRLPKPLAGSARASEAGQDHKPGEPGIANPGSDKAPTIAGQDCLPLAESSKGQKQPAHQRPLSSMASRPSRGQITSSNSQSPESPKLNVLNNDSSPPQKHNSSPQKQGTPESPQGSHQELQGLLSQVQTLEKEASRSVDVQALRKLFEGVPQLGGGVPQAPTAPHMTEASMEQAFGELTRVSTEVAQLKEQTLARLLDIEEAVHKALSSMSSLQSEAPTSSHPQGTTKDPSVNKVSVSSRAIQTSSSQVRDPPLVKTQEKAESHPEDKMRNHAEARGQAAVNVLPSRRLETLRGAEPGLLQVSPPCTGSSSPTFISVQSATKKLPEASSPQGSHYISGKNTHLGQDIGQALLYQRDIQDQAGTKEMCIEGAVLTGQPKNVLEFQTGSTTSKSYGAMRTVTEQYEEMDQFGNTVLTSSTTITQHADPLTDPRPQLCLHTSPMLRQLLHSPSRLNSDLAEAEITWTPCNNFHPAAQ